MTADLGWYLRRLSRMGPAEIAGRTLDAWRVHRWRTLDAAGTPLDGRRFAAALPVAAPALVTADAAARLVRAANRVMDGRVTHLGVTRDDMAGPDWSFDPSTGRRAPADRYAFDIPYRNEGAVGNIKQLWEPSRHQHLTVLAGAYALTGEQRYAERVADHLKSWWAANPPLRGVHWVSGIELGIRLISWVWTRRLLEGWPGAAGLFEDNAEALHQLWHHQRWLAAFPSRGSSANNHAVAEAAGQLAGACAFGWFPESARWRASAARRLDRHLRANTFGSGLNRELATEYHGLVLELGLAAATEADAAGFPLPDSTWDVLLRMTDALAAIVDVRLCPPRQGDGDDGHGLVVDGTGTNRWASLLATGERLFGRPDWWPRIPRDDARTPLLTALARPRVRPAARPGPPRFPDAGLTILRAGTPGGEIWCRCDGGPHGFLSIAAHAHADALAVEVRHDGVEVLSDPGTFCYHGSPGLRAYFRSTLGHNTLELEGTDQSASGGPFLWSRHARSRVLTEPGAGSGAGTRRWCAEHDGYRPAVHRRTVELDAARGELWVRDEVRGAAAGHGCRLAFHLGPRIHVERAGRIARLSWKYAGRHRGAVLTLPPELRWTAHRGETDPPLGWYSPGFGRLEPATTLLGSGTAGPDTSLVSVLRFDGRAGPR